MLVENQEDSPQGSDIQGLSADLLEAARRRNLSANSLAAYERTWTRFLAWAAALNFDPRRLPFPEALEVHGRAVFRVAYRVAQRRDPASTIVLAAS